MKKIFTLLAIVSAFAAYSNAAIMDKAAAEAQAPSAPAMAKPNAQPDMDAVKKMFKAASKPDLSVLKDKLITLNWDRDYGKDGPPHGEQKYSKRDMKVLAYSGKFYLCLGYFAKNAKSSELDGGYFTMGSLSLLSETPKSYVAKKVPCFLWYEALQESQLFEYKSAELRQLGNILLVNIENEEAGLFAHSDFYGYAILK